MESTSELFKNISASNSHDNFYSIQEIAFWQLNHLNAKVELPTLQRTFVWRPSQVEELWDSLLRGFPISSFLLLENGAKYYLMDGQQRATSIALGVYNPWSEEQKAKFWSLKHVPVLWIDLAPKERALSQRFVLRLVTRSHPWGYQRKNNRSVLSIADRRAALSIFKEIPGNNDGYTSFPSTGIFPYDCDVPVPLSLVLEAISEHPDNWREMLYLKCKELLPEGIKTKGCPEGYFYALKEALEPANLKELDEGLRRLQNLRIPAIVIENEVLQSEDETDQQGTDPTLFVRINSSGTPIGGEELIYSIYKSIFSDSKKMVEQIGSDLIAPSLVISLVSRIAYTELNNGNYPAPMSVNDFRRRIREPEFKSKMQELIGPDIDDSPVKQLFNSALKILKGAGETELPLVLVGRIIRETPDLFLMLLCRLREDDKAPEEKEEQKMLSVVTALHWFCKDIKKYVRQHWKYSATIFYKGYILPDPLNNNEFLMPYLATPGELRDYFIKKVVEEKTIWDELELEATHEIYNSYNRFTNPEHNPEVRIEDMWNVFTSRLVWNRSLLLFAQREYIKNQFRDFDQFESMEDTNVPWDWDHIYPSDWVYAQKNVRHIMRHWNNTIGNLRALALEQNRGEGHRKSPSERLDEPGQSFIKSNDMSHWRQLTGRIDHESDAMVECYLSAVLNRLCNIYEDWHDTLNIVDLFKNILKTTE